MQRLSGVSLCMALPWCALCLGCMAHRGKKQHLHCGVVSVVLCKPRFGTLACFVISTSRMAVLACFALMNNAIESTNILESHTRCFGTATCSVYLCKLDHLWCCVLQFFQMGLAYRAAANTLVKLLPALETAGLRRLFHFLPLLQTGHASTASLRVSSFSFATQLLLNGELDFKLFQTKRPEVSCFLCLNGLWLVSEHSICHAMRELTCCAAQSRCRHSTTSETCATRQRIDRIACM